jgi:hypothetical protein
MGLFVFGDFYQILIKGVGKPNIEEVLTDEICKPLTIEGVLGVLECLRVRKDGKIIIASTSPSLCMRSGIAPKQSENRGMTSFRKTVGFAKRGVSGQ